VLSRYDNRSIYVTCQGEYAPCQRKVRSSGFVQNEKFRF
jgi:hypothetical protein